jgi:hypothetical protein
MTTGADVVIQGLKKSGVTGQGRTPSADDSQDALSDLNDMLAEWNTQRWMIWHLLDLGVVSNGRQTPYTIGPTGDFNVARRPDRLESAFLRQLVSTGLDVDTFIEIIPSWEEYAQISLKKLQSFSLYGFLDSTWPLGNLYIYPWPQAARYEFHVQLKDVLPIIDLVTDLSTIPDQYVSAMKFNLARRLRQAYGKGLAPDPELNNLARNSLDVVKTSNIAVPELKMPKALIRMSSSWNILSDQFSGNG